MVGQVAGTGIKPRLVHWWPKIVLEAEKAPRERFLIPSTAGFKVLYDPLNAKAKGRSYP